MIYIAAPLFNPRERAFNLKLKAIIGRSVYLPQEDGELMENLIRRGETVEYAADLVYKNDLRALHASEAMVAVLDGAHLDSGVAFEIGFFNALAACRTGASICARRRQFCRKSWGKSRHQS